jgi:tRNA(Arg) A34 adenosine deaminase TadA
MYSSIEPCIMCLGASMWASISKIVYACNKSRVSSDYYGGNYKTADLNNTFSKQIEIIHLAELEDASFEIISEWEEKMSQ